MNVGIKKQARVSASENPFEKVDVQLAQLCKMPPEGAEWLYEVKYDGYRIVAFVTPKGTKLYTRNKIDFTSKFKVIAEELTDKCKGNAAILDGEVVAVDEKGVTDFSELVKSLKERRGGQTYMVFDILAYGGEDVRGQPLEKRKCILKLLSDRSYNHIGFASGIGDNGARCFEAAKNSGLEGIIAKRRTSVYSGGRTNDWLKIKCRKISEFVIGGFSLSKKQDYLSALLLGYYDKDKLVYAGKVGTGFDQKQRKQIRKMLDKLIIDKSAFVSVERSEDKLFFVKPLLVCVAEYAELTRDKLLRQASYKGLRGDKSAREITLEKI